MLGFPCDQFGGQEPGDEEEIASFCERNFGVTSRCSPRSTSTATDGPPALPRGCARRSRGLLGSAIKWNFTKFLVGRDGTVVDRYGPTTEPEKIAADIEQAL